MSSAAHTGAPRPLDDRGGNVVHLFADQAEWLAGSMLYVQHRLDLIFREYALFDEDCSESEFHWVCPPLVI